MTLICVDVEADGPCPGLYSMVCFGAVIVEPGLDRSFYGQTAPVGPEWDDEALAVSGISRSLHLTLPAPLTTMRAFDAWMRECVGDSKPTMISDNPAFDWQFINFYMHKYCGGNRLGHSARRIGDLYCGMERDMNKNQEWKAKYRSGHDHDPVNDARSNAKALLAMADLGLKGIL